MILPGFMGNRFSFSVMRAGSTTTTAAKLKRTPIPRKRPVSRNARLSPRIIRKNATAVVSAPVRIPSPAWESAAWKALVPSPCSSTSSR